MSTVELITLGLDGSYSRQKADVDDKFIRGRKDGGSVTIKRNSTFNKNKPLPFDTLEELLAATTPLADKTARKRQVVAGFEDSWPVQFNESDIQAEALGEAATIKRIARQGAIYRASENAAKEHKKAQSYFVLAVGAACSLGVLALVVTMKVLF